MKPHKHKDLIIAWANGAVIETQTPTKAWAVTEFPNWSVRSEFRVQKDKTDVERYGVEAGDVWYTIYGGCIVDCTPVKNWDRATAIKFNGCIQNTIGKSQFLKLLFRRGVVNDLRFS